MEEEGEGPNKIKHVIREKSNHFKVFYMPST